MKCLEKQQAGRIIFVWQINLCFYLKGRRATKLPQVILAGASGRMIPNEDTSLWAQTICSHLQILVVLLFAFRIEFLLLAAEVLNFVIPSCLQCHLLQQWVFLNTSNQIPYKLSFASFSRIGWMATPFWADRTRPHLPRRGSWWNKDLSNDVQLFKIKPRKCCIQTK